VIEKKSQRHL